MLNLLLPFLDETEDPDIDAIAVTEGPGLEPALWVGINAAYALSIAWEKPLIPIDHMYGHTVASLVRDNAIRDIKLPLLSLLISGAHTELVLTPTWGSQKIIGATKDDAVGECFDKAARLLNLPYPGGPHISRLAEEARQKNIPKLSEPLPRPMINSGDFDFSFSGLKTAILYRVRDADLTKEYILQMAREIEDAITETLIKKTTDALLSSAARSLSIGGGVAANMHIRDTFTATIHNDFPIVELYLGDPKLSTDNAIMIGLAALDILLTNTPPSQRPLRAYGNRKRMPQ